MMCILSAGNRELDALRLTIVSGKLSLTVVHCEGGARRNANVKLVAGGRTMPYDEWCHVVGTCVAGGDELRTYVNGRLDRKLRMPSAFTSLSGPVYVGQDLFGNAAQYNGLIDEVCLFGRALSDAEVKTLASWPARW
jgi:hypothetical protein